VNEVINKKVQLVELGLMDYQAAWEYQEKLFKSTIEIKLANRARAVGDQVSTPNFLLTCEHPHVFTLGKSGVQANLLLDNDGLARHRASFYKINRGGDITYHGPGQIVGYPILDLENFFTDIHRYLRLLEEAVIVTLHQYAIDAGRIKGLTGVWLDYEKQYRPRKICAIGVKTSRWVTMHGFAFNVNTDLSYFDHIIPCGISDKDVTSMDKELGQRVDLKEVESVLVKNIFELFEMEEEAP